ncbi:hypothetical protein [Fervidobacterium gondwanense]|uniref:Uncharacterized protein n=1 Tax=Fervidobacterium gondwanense DSM 13020 TaxID=1121883 RepID=A0A1M7SVG6_FERGO|nr:hypothetical protein [Fervidobacterium gondwanense]SHN62400.1 hypothetical protein SAMN02745226_01283 [Fervidobacterium gondwanense DSM 13020]
MKWLAIMFHSLMFSVVNSYSTFYSLFPNFSFGYFPVLFVILYALCLGAKVSLREILLISVLSPIFSFFLLQFLSYLLFSEYATYQILLTVVAKGSVGFGFAWMLISVVVGSISNLVFFKNKH